MTNSRWLSHPRLQRELPRSLTLIACLGSLAGAVACDTNLLEQDAPSRVSADILDNPTNATLLVNGAISDVECALAAYIVAGGLVGDELLDAQLSSAGFDYDRRTMAATGGSYATNQCESTQAVGLYTPISVARFQADDATRRLEAWTDAQVANRTTLIATAAAYAGYSLVLLGEGMCSAAIDLGPELTPAQILALAEARFTRALDAATQGGNPAMRDLALVGRARARLGLGKKADARTDALLVPDGFVRNATYSGVVARRENRVFTQLYRDNYASVDVAFRDLEFGGVADPRVAVTNSGTRGQDGSTPVWRAAKYPAIGTPIAIGRWAEAQLIIAEVDRTTNLQSAVSIINVLHTRAGLPAFSSNDPNQVLYQIIDERRRELFLEGHRLGDIIRFHLPLVPVPGTPFPKAGGAYGSQLCFPLPDIERLNNPNLH